MLLKKHKFGVVSPKISFGEIRYGCGTSNTNHDKSH